MIDLSEKGLIFPMISMSMCVLLQNDGATQLLKLLLQCLGVVLGHVLLQDLRNGLDELLGLCGHRVEVKK